MVAARIGRRPLWGAAVMLVALAVGGACSVAGTAGPNPDVRTLLILLPGNDTVLVDIESGVVTSGPIESVGNADFSAQFFAVDGTPDDRVTEGTYRLDVTPANTGIVTFTRASAFSGTFNRVAAGSTDISFTLLHVAEARNLFVRTVPITMQ